MVPNPKGVNQYSKRGGKNPISGSRVFGVAKGSKKKASTTKFGGFHKAYKGK